jgi:hypothetical protein
MTNVATRAAGGALIVVLMLGARPASQSAPPVAIVNGTVIDVRAGQLVPSTTILTIGNRIAAIGPTSSLAVPARSHVIDAAGKYVMPGLWDMHAHLGAGGPATEIDMPLFLANGVTGLREMWSDCYLTSPDCLAEKRAWQRRVEDGELLGPRILALGSWPVNGSRGLPAGSPLFFAAATAEQGRDLARYFAERNVDFIKIYPGMPREGFFALAAEARRLGLGLAGHEAPAVTAVEASDAGQQSFEHARVFLVNCFPRAAELARLGPSASASSEWRRRMVDEYDPSTCGLLFSRFVRNGSRYVPTHLTRRMDAYARDRSFRDDPRAKFVPRSQWTRWNNDADGAARRLATPEVQKAMLDFYTKGLEITGAAHKAGVKVLLGTDAGDSYVFPGFSVHDELQELVKAGLSPTEALRAATWEGAVFLGRTSDAGSLEPAKLADMVVLDANPLADVRNASKIHAVIFNGRPLDRRTLDQLLANAEAAAKRQQ